MNSKVADNQELGDGRQYLETFSQLNKFRKENVFCDVKVKVNNHVYPVHRIVLSALSSYFQVMFHGAFSESSQQEVEIKEFEHDIMETIIDYAYTSKFKTNKLDALALLSAADHFQILTLKDEVSEYLETQIDDSNCIELYNFADTFNCSKLKKTSKSYILRNFSDLYKQDEFLKLSYEVIRDFTASDDLIVDKEEIVFEAIHNWYKSSSSTRQHDFFKLLETVRFDRMNPYFLLDITQKYPIITECEKVEKDIKEILLFLTFPKRKTTISSSKHRRMVFDEFGLAAYKDMVYVARNDNKIYPFKRSLNQWQDELKPLIKIESTPALTISDGYLYVAFGFSGGFKIQRMDLKDNIWTLLDPFHYRNSCTRTPVAVEHEKLYYVGFLNKCLSIHNPRSNSWRFSEEMRSEISQYDRLGICSLDQYIYVIGHQGVQVERYDVDTDTWEYVAPMHEEKSNPGIAVHDGKIFVRGAMDKPVEVYDPYFNQWSFSDLPTSYTSPFPRE